LSRPFYTFSEKSKSYLKDTLRFTLPLCALAGYLFVSRQGAKRQRKIQAFFAESLFFRKI